MQNEPNTIFRTKRIVCVVIFWTHTNVRIFATKSFTHKLQSLVENMGYIRQYVYSKQYLLLKVWKYWRSAEGILSATREGSDIVITFSTWSKWWYNSNGNGIDYHLLNTCEGEEQESTNGHAFLETLYFRLTINNQNFVLLQKCVRYLANYW